MGFLLFLPAFILVPARLLLAVGVSYCVAEVPSSVEGGCELGGPSGVNIMQIAIARSYLFIL